MFGLVFKRKIYKELYSDLQDLRLERDMIISGAQLSEQPRLREIHYEMGAIKKVLKQFNYY